MANDLGGRVSEHVVLVVGEGLRGGDDDRVSGVHAHGVEVLHVAHGDAVVGGVAHHFVLHLFPTQHTPLNEDLWRDGQRLGGHRPQVRLVFANTRAKASKGEGTSDHHREPANLIGSLHRVLDRFYSDRDSHLLIDLVELVREQLSVFSGNDHIDRSTQHGHTVLFKDALAVHLDSAVKSRLATHANEDAIGFLALDDFLHEIGVYREEKHLVCGLRGIAAGVGLHGSDVRVHQDHLLAFFLQCLDSLSSGVVELTSLANA
mmetsp:Transcript_12334/g.25099  ORF Transcript_12334/g.25099 Transcript_12334/m.25099 type:complete len:261 (+) Transcript_12334:2724-3506(+)